jgi:aryl-alcohol dehydrogenase-like predicted oxidoreductase
MERRLLGSTGIQISRLAFGCGPVAALMTGERAADQLAVVQCALDAGIEWFDTAAGYGDGASEAALGRAVRELGAASRVHVATKVRLLPEQLEDVRTHVRRSVEQSLGRLGLDRVALLQLHNSVTPRRGDEPTSIMPADVLGRGGVLDAFRELRDEGRAAHIGLTGLGDPVALREVIRSGAFETVQAPYHFLNASAGRAAAARAGDADHGEVFVEARAQSMGCFAIRVFAGGALAGRPPSEHTHRTRFFPLELYRRDEARAARLQARLGAALRGRFTSLKELALRFALSHEAVSAAIVGFAAVDEVREAVELARAGPLEPEVLSAIEAASREEV